MQDPVTWMFYRMGRGAFHVGAMVGMVLRDGIRAIGRAKNRPPRIPEAERVAIRKKDNETERLARCHKIVLELREDLGYIAAQAISMEEVNAQIKGGISPDDLVKEILSRIDKVRGVTLGKRHFPEFTYDMKLPYSLRDKHAYIVGRSGGGKTELIRSMILQDMFYGCGVGVMAPEGELLTDQLLPFIPDDRIDDVVYVNPADTAYPVAFNPLHLEEDENIEQKYQDTLSVFKRLMGDRTGARMDAILRHSLYALIAYPHTTLLDIEKLLDPTDSAFRHQIVRTTEDEQTRRFFEKTYPEFPKDASLPITNRFSPLLRPRVIRNLLCNPTHSFNFRKAMDSGKILLFNLSDGLLGEEASQLLGQFVVSKIQLAVMSRVDTEMSKRRPFYFYLDEFQTFTGINELSYSNILSRARKYKMGLCLAHQHTGQIPQNLLRDIFGNVTTLISFNVGSDDAVKLSNEYAAEVGMEIEHVRPDKFLRLRTGQAICKIDRTVFEMETHLLPSDFDRDRRDFIIKRARRNYGLGGNNNDSGGWTAEMKRPPQIPPPKPSSERRNSGIDPRNVF